MSIGLVLQFKGVNISKYDAVMKDMGLTGDKSAWPDGIISHVAGPTADGLCVVDVWQSQAQFDKFFQGRVMPAIKRAGGMPDPQVIKFEVQNSYKHGG
jgi:hypothetical protein